MNYYRREKRKAFTLVELLIVIAFLVILLSLTIPYGTNFYREQVLSEEAASVAESLKGARSRAMAWKNRSSWGVAFNKPEEGQYTLFQGETYEGRSEEEIRNDQIFTLTPGMEIEGPDEIVFEKFTGRLYISPEKNGG